MDISCSADHLNSEPCAAFSVLQHLIPSLGGKWHVQPLLWVLNAAAGLLPIITSPHPAVLGVTRLRKTADGRRPWRGPNGHFNCHPHTEQQEREWCTGWAGPGLGIHQGSVLMTGRRKEETRWRRRGTGEGERWGSAGRWEILALVINKKTTGDRAERREGWCSNTDKRYRCRKHMYCTSKVIDQGGVN